MPEIHFFMAGRNFDQAWLPNRATDYSAGACRGEQCFIPARGRHHIVVAQEQIFALGQSGRQVGGGAEALPVLGYAYGDRVFLQVIKILSVVSVQADDDLAMPAL